jgi:hypothetical protein
MVKGPGQHAVRRFSDMIRVIYPRSDSAEATARRRPGEQRLLLEVHLAATICFRFFEPHGSSEKHDIAPI